jgi:hypothetical protein
VGDSLHDIYRISHEEGEYSERLHCTVKKLLIRKIPYALFLITVFIGQVATLAVYLAKNVFQNSSGNINATHVRA